MTADEMLPVGTQLLIPADTPIPNGWRNIDEVAVIGGKIKSQPHSSGMVSLIIIERVE